MSTSETSHTSSVPSLRTAILLLPPLVLLAIVLVRTAWHSDDAYITFRTIDNFVNGYGLRWNTLERVQAYTHPLWMFLLAGAYAVTREIHVTALIVSIMVTVSAAGIVLGGVARTPTSALLAFAALLFSNAFIDYGTSGLENPLTALLLACFLARYFATEGQPGHIFGLSLIAGLAVLNRMDTLLFYAPPLAWRCWQARSMRSLLALSAGFVPFAAWEIFSLIYYGFLTPNTAFAKLNTGAETIDLIQQGFGYYLSTFDRDPFTLMLIATGIAVPLVLRDRPGMFAALGVVLYLVYIVRIGGDFMQGRFFSGPALVAAALLSRAPWRPRDSAPALLVMLVLFLCSPYPSALQGEDYGADRWKAGTKRPHAAFVDERYVKDERGLDYPFTGLLSMRDTGWAPDHRWVDVGERYRDSADYEVRAHRAIGWKGFFAGPNTFIVDEYALSDPLLARLPARYQKRWLVGHFRRNVPEGYLDSVASGENKIVAPGVAAYYDKLCLITRGPIWSLARWRAIVKMNLGLYEPLLAEYRATCCEAKS